MVNELRSLLHDSTDNPPYAAFDAAAVLRAGRSRTRRRRAAVAGVAGLAAAAVVVGSSFALDTFRSSPDLAAAGVPTPEGPVLRLTDATAAIEGRDYRVLASHTNDDLEADNGQYLDGLTEDGLVLFRDGPRMDQLFPRFALMDPATGDWDWLPDPDIGQQQTWPLALGKDRLVLLGSDGGNGETMGLVAHVFDRDTRQWTTRQWPDLPGTDGPWSAELGPDDRVYVPVPATQGKPPEGGWPIQPGGDAEDADAEGDTFDLWSASLTDSEDIRDEGLRVGDFTFTDDSLVWTDRTNGDSGMLHVRDLATGEETEFDPQAGEKCNLLSFGATDERIVLGQYCGTYEDGVRDDRVQVLSTSGEQITTIQGSDLEGHLASGREGLVSVTSHERGTRGTYVYDLSDDEFVRVSDSVSPWTSDGITTAGHLMWDTSANGGKGSTQLVVEWQG